MDVNILIKHLANKLFEKQSLKRLLSLVALAPTKSELKKVYSKVCKIAQVQIKPLDIDVAFEEVSRECGYEWP